MCWQLPSMSFSIRRLVTRGTLWIDCFLPHDLLWGKNPGVAGCYKTMPSLPFWESWMISSSWLLTQYSSRCYSQQFSLLRHSWLLRLQPMELSQVMLLTVLHTQGMYSFSHQQDTRIELIILLVTQATPLPRLLQLLNDNGQTIILPSWSQIRKLCAMEEHPLLLLPMSQAAL